MTPKLNAKGKPFTWSFSALDTFENNCPLQYAGKYFYCNIPYTETEATIWGNRVHKAGELVLKRKDHNDPEAYAPVKTYVETMLASGWDVQAELEIALNRNLQRVKWFAKDAWLRVKIDVVLRKLLTAVLADWKTGKNIKDLQDQLRLNIAALSIVHPEIELYHGKYIWTAHDVVTGIKPITKADLSAIWEDFLARARRLEQAWITEKFGCRPSGLCKGWCQVKTCVHWEPKREKRG